MSFSILSGIAKSVSSIVPSSRRKRDIDNDPKEVESRPNKLIKVDDVSGLVVVLQEGLEGIQNSVSTQMEHLANKFKGMEEKGRKYEEEIKSLKAVLNQGGIEKKRVLLDKIKDPMIEAQKPIEVVQPNQEESTQNLSLQKDASSIPLDLITQVVASCLEKMSTGTLLNPLETHVTVPPELQGQKVTPESKDAHTERGTKSTSDNLDETKDPEKSADSPTNGEVTITATKSENMKPDTTIGTTTTTNAVANEAQDPNPEEIAVDKDLRFDSLSGLDEQIILLRENVLLQIANKNKLLEFGLEPIKGVVFHGDSWDMMKLAKTLISELSLLLGQDVSMLHRPKYHVFQRYNGRSEAYLTKLFKEAIAKKPAVIFIEDIHTMYWFNEYKDSAKEIVRVLVKEMGKIESGEVLVIVTTDEAKKVTADLKGKGMFEKSIAFSLPNEDRRKALLLIQTEKWTQKPSEEMMEQLVKKTDKCTFAELSELGRLAFFTAMERRFTSIKKEPCGRCQCLKEVDKVKLPDSYLESMDVLAEDWDLALDTIKKRRAQVAKSQAPQLQQNIHDEVEIDSTLGFASVGGLEEQVKSVKENIIFPFSNKEALGQWGVEPVKGIIFHGPPGTGKTLLAKALGAELSRLTETPFSFFYRKGSDCFQRYQGETEGIIRNLFARAVAKKPAIIFFDEIDGLCPARKEDSSASKFYNAIVTTMLGQLDDIKRGEVFVIAATNRLEVLDPALTRPGRFDKAIAFYPPKEDGRKAILQIHSAQWKRGRCDETLSQIARKTVGYTGADLEQLCRQTFLCALRRQFPNMEQPKDGNEGFSSLDILLQDWSTALNTVKGSDSKAFGNSVTSGKAIIPDVTHLLSGIVAEIISKLQPFLTFSSSVVVDKGSGINSFLIWDRGTSQSRVIDNFIVPSLLSSSQFKDTISFTLDEGQMTPLRLKGLMHQILTCDKRAILWIPAMDLLDTQLCAKGSKVIFLEQMDALRGENVLVLGTAPCSLEELGEDYRRIFKGIQESREYKVRTLEREECRQFFEPVLKEFPSLMSIMEEITTRTNFYDILDLKADLARVASAAGENAEAKEVQLKGVLDSFEKVDRSVSTNSMYI